MRGFPRSKTISVAVVSLSMILLSFSLPHSSAKPGEFVLKWEEGWHTYDSTAAFSVFAEDIDGDGVVEIVTGGTAVVELQTLYYGQLRVWHKDWCTLTLEDSEEWTSYPDNDDAVVMSVYVADADSDGEMEIVTVGYETLGGMVNGNLSIWSWDGSQLSLDAWTDFIPPGFNDAWFYSVVVQEITGDSHPEIVVTGSITDTWGGYHGVLAIWNYDGSILGQPVAFNIWQYDEMDTEARAVSIGDVDHDGLLEEIVTAGHVVLNSNHGVDLRIWRFENNDISQLASVDPPWYPTGYIGANASSVQVNDLNGDSDPEIVIAGSANSTTLTEGMVSIWDWDGIDPSLQLLAHREWWEERHTEAWAVSSLDVDDDGFTEIATAGTSEVFIPPDQWDTYAQLAVWRWDGGSDIYDDVPSSSRIEWMHTGAEQTTVARDLFLGDVDPDSEIEIVTAGEYVIFDSPSLAHREAEIRIWTWNTPPPHNEWLQMCPAVHPSARTLHGMAYDSQSDLIVLFGGTTDPWSPGPGEEFADTWVYDYQANTWTDMTPTQTDHPSARQRHGMAYDSESDVVVLFGGTVSHITYDLMEDTWVYDYETNDWTDMTQGQGGVHPSARMDPMMEYCPETDRVVLFGGSTTTLDLSYETWIYDYNSNQWEDITDPNNHPPGRSAADMAYDGESGEIVLFGGYGPGNLQDTWAFDCTLLTWEYVSQPPTPHGRWWHAMAYDAADDRVVMFGGGYSSFGTSLDLGDTWIFDLNSMTWTRLYPASSPSKRFGMRMEYFATADVIVMFGGAHFQDGLPIELFSETWVFIY